MFALVRRLGGEQPETANVHDRSALGGEQQVTANVHDRSDHQRHRRAVSSVLEKFGQVFRRVEPTRWPPEPSVPTPANMRPAG